MFVKFAMFTAGYNNILCRTTIVDVTLVIVVERFIEIRSIDSRYYAECQTNLLGQGNL